VRTLAASFLLSFFALTGLASATIYWGGGPPIGRVNLDGKYPQTGFIPIPPPIGGGESEGVQYIGCAGIAVNGSHIYWADPVRDTIGRANIDGTEANYALITGADNPCGVAVNGTHVFWANFAGNSIGRARLDGTEPTQNFVGATTEPCGVAVDGRFIYWTSSSLSFIGRALLQGGFRGPNLVEGIGTYDLCGVAVSDAHIYWGGFGEVIGRADLNGSNPDPLFITGIERPCGLTIYGNRLYWSEQSPSSPLVGSANLDGTSVSRGGSDWALSSSCGIAVDGLSYEPPLPRPPSLFAYGKVKHDRRKWTSYLEVKLPQPGSFRVTVPRGVKSILLPEGATPGISVDGGGQRWIKVWPASRDRGGARLRREIRRKGRASVVIAGHYVTPGKNGNMQRRRLSLIGLKR
jgi:hypothetical protein